MNNDELLFPDPRYEIILDRIKKNFNSKQKLERMKTREPDPCVNEFVFISYRDSNHQMISRLSYYSDLENDPTKDPSLTPLGVVKWMEYQKFLKIQNSINCS